MLTSSTATKARQQDNATALENNRRRREQVYQAQRRHRQRNSNRLVQLETELQVNATPWTKGHIELY